MMRGLKKILFIALMLFQAVASSQELQRANKDTAALSGKIEEVTISAFRSPNNLFNTPAPVNVITPLQLEMGNSLTTVEALNQVSGVLMHNGTLNTNRLTIRGIGSRTPYSTNKIKAYFGEIPLTSGDGETTLEDLENTAIRRVEIVKGPSSSLFGAGLAGVILFHPKTTTQNFAQNQATIGSFGTIKDILSAGIHGNKLNIFALGSILKSDGYRDNNETNRSNILINSIYSFSPNANLQVLLKSTKMKAYIPSSLDLPTFQEQPEQAAANWKNIEGYEEYTNGQFGISLNLTTNSGHKISAATFGSFRDADELRPFNRLTENSNYVGWRAYVQKSINGSPNKFIVSSGIEFFRERYNWSTFSNTATAGLLSDNMEKRQYENLFIQVESNFHERVFISAGINGNLTRFYYTDEFIENGDLSGDQTYQPIISPRLGANVVMNRSLSVFGNASHGFSTPTFEETLLPAGDINPDIKPETGWNTEIGVRSQISDRVQFTASYYRIYIKNLLVARRTGEDAYVGVNAGKSLHPGFETEIRYNVTNPLKLPSFMVTGTATIANYHFSDFVDDEIDYSGNNLPGTSKTAWFIFANFNPGKNFSLNLWYRYTGKMAVNDANTDFADAFGITGFETKYSGKLNRFKLELKGGIQNIFDIKYASMLAVNAPAVGGRLPRYYYPGNPRNYFFSVLIGVE
ncbi:MAG: iron complex outermembrane recepter [Prolixibacteraceae bacterium]|nr:MAG: iron complex outermembrane recepter [Prolixibacteraceae bacterium]